MALTVTNLTTATSTTSSSTLAATGITAAVGDWLYVAVAADNAGTDGVASLSTSMTDSAGNTYTNRTIATRDPGSANAGATLGIWTAQVTTALSSGSITANFSPATTAKAMQVKKVSPGASEQILFDRAGTAQTGSSDAPTQVTGSIFGGGYAVPSGRTVFFAIAAEISSAATGDSDTTAGSWSTIYNAVADGGSDATSQTVASQQKTVTSTSFQSWTPTLNDPADYAMNWLVLYTASLVLVDVTGVAGTSRLGSVALSLGAVQNASGVQVSADVGSVGVSAAAAVPVSGVSAQVQLGEVDVPLPGYATAFVAGFELHSGLGSVTTLLGSTVLASGVSTTVSLGVVQTWGALDDNQTPNWQNIADSQTPGWAPVADIQTPGWRPIL